MKRLFQWVLSIYQRWDHRQLKRDLRLQAEIKTSREIIQDRDRWIDSLLNLFCGHCSYWSPGKQTYISCELCPHKQSAELK
jgi:hypothetical protein